MRKCGGKNMKWRQQQHNHHKVECLYSMFFNHHICAILQCCVRHIDSWNCPSCIHPNILKSWLYTKRCSRLGCCSLGDMNLRRRISYSGWATLAKWTVLNMSIVQCERRTRMCRNLGFNHQKYVRGFFL